jgi:hypothetical protein
MGFIASIFSPSFRLGGMSGQAVKAKPFGFAPRSLDRPAFLMPRSYRGDGERSGEDASGSRSYPFLRRQFLFLPSRRRDLL